MKHYTEKEFETLLAAFKAKDKSLVEESTTLVLSGEVYISERYKEIPNYMKRSLARKVARNIAITALTSVAELDELAKGRFEEYSDGGRVSFAKYVK